MTESKIVFPICEADPLLWGTWIQEVIKISLCEERNVRNNQGHRETVNFYTMVVMGLRWNFDIEFWRADVADLEQLTPQAIAEHCPRLQHGELLIIEEDINSLHLRDRKIHRSMQAAIRQAVMNATTRLSFFT